MPLPIHIIKSKDNIADIKDIRCFLVGANGIFLRVSNKVGVANINITEMAKIPGTKDKVYNIGGLAEIKAVSYSELPIIPYSIISQAVSFFRAIYEKNKSEAFLILYINKITKEYKLVCPPQIVSSMHVKWEMPNRKIEGYVHIGDIHSHHTMAGFQSSGDQSDEEKCEDGIYITVGHIDKMKPNFNIRLVFNGTTFAVNEHNTKDYIEWPLNIKLVVNETSFDIDENDIPIGAIQKFVKQSNHKVEFPPEWIQQVKEDTYKSYGIVYNGEDDEDIWNTKMYGRDAKKNKNTENEKRNIIPTTDPPSYIFVPTLDKNNINRFNLEVISGQ